MTNSTEPDSLLQLALVFFTFAGAPITVLLIKLRGKRGEEFWRPFIGYFGAGVDDPAKRE